MDGSTLITGKPSLASIFKQSASRLCDAPFEGSGGAQLRSDNGHLNINSWIEEGAQAVAR